MWQKKKMVQDHAVITQTKPNTETNHHRASGEAGVAYCRERT